MEYMNTAPCSIIGTRRRTPLAHRRGTARLALCTLEAAPPGGHRDRSSSATRNAARLLRLLVKLASPRTAGLRMTELAMSAKITRSAPPRARDRALEEKRLGAREALPSDKRGQFAVLTDEGRRCTTHAPGHVDAVRQAVFDRPHPEQREVPRQ
ncbi:hypothetical protein GCM10023238_15610 [Streptomyces heliomycini]